MVVLPVVVVVATAALSTPQPSVAGRRGYVVWWLTLLILMAATFMSPPPGSNLATTKVLHLPNAVAFGPICTSRTVPTRNLIYLFASYSLKHSASEVTCSALVSILVPMVQRGSVGAIGSVNSASFLTFLSRVFWCLYAPPRQKKNSY